MNVYYNIEESGARIRQLRTKNGYTQEKLARKLNIDRSFYSKIESGKNGCSVDLLIQLSELFDVSLDYLVLGKHERTSLKKAESMLLKDDINRLAIHLEQFSATL